MPKVRNLHFIVFLIGTLLFSTSEALQCKSLFSRPGKSEAVLEFEKETEILKTKIFSLETLVEETAGNLYSPNCFKASKALGEMLLVRFGIKTVFIGTSVFVDYPHYYLIIPNYYGYGEHLYIDPTLQQFFVTQVPQPIFVGPKAKLLAFAREQGAFKDNPRFKSEYFGMKNPPASPLQQFRQEDYP